MVKSGEIARAHRVRVGSVGGFVGWGVGRIATRAKCRARAPLQQGERPVGDENEGANHGISLWRGCHIHFPKLINV